MAVQNTYGAKAQGGNPMPSAAGAPNAAQGGIIPFPRAVLEASVQGTPQSVTLGTNVQNMSIVVPAVGGWNRRISLIVSNLTAGNAVGTVALAADAPYNVFTQILFKDAAQKQLNLFTNGYHGFLMNQFGGYKPYGMNSSIRASIFTASGATGGSFTFVMDIPQEIMRDGIGCYPNMDSSQRLGIDLTINTSANLYSTPPTNPGVLTVTPVVWYYTKPADTNADGMPQETAPVGAGTLQFWRTLNYVLSANANIITVQLSGRYVRNIIGVFTDASDVRSDTVRPTTYRAELDNNLVWDAVTIANDNNIFRTFGIDDQTGVLPFMIGTTDPDGAPGNEWGDRWWQTSTASQLVLKFNAGAVGKLYLLLNEIEVVGNIFR